MINMCLAANVNFDPIYIILNLLLLFVFFVAGSNVSQGDSYWDNALLCVITFVFVLGSRYMRGHDYAHYIDAYLHGDKGHEFLFTWMNKSLQEVVGVSKYMIFYIYAIPFILAGFKFLQNFRKESIWMFPVFLIAMIYFEEYEIRQAFGFTFVFLFLDEIINKNHTKKKKILICLIYILLSIGIHSANILFIVAVILLFFLLKSVISWQITIPCLFFASYIFPELYDISYINPILNILGASGNAKFEQYTQGNAAEAWFGETALQMENARNPIIKVLDFFANSALFYFSCKLYDRKKRILGYIRIIRTKHPRFYYSFNMLMERNISKEILIVTLINLYIIGDIAKQAFLYLEILNRLAGMFQRMWFVPFVLVIFSLRFSKLNVVEKLAYCMMLFLFYDYAKYLFAPIEGYTKFLWDI